MPTNNKISSIDELFAQMADEPYIFSELELQASVENLYIGIVQRITNDVDLYKYVTASVESARMWMGQHGAEILIHAKLHPHEFQGSLQAEPYPEGSAGDYVANGQYGMLMSQFGEDKTQWIYCQALTKLINEYRQELDSVRKKVAFNTAHHCLTNEQYQEARHWIDVLESI